MVENSIFIAVASILRAFTISQAVDSSGNLIPLEEKWIQGLATYVPSGTLQKRTCNIDVCWQAFGAFCVFDFTEGR
jgi:hypothetical protein